MSFTINLQCNNSDDNVLSKSLANLKTVTGSLKSETSILSPVILIEGEIPTNCNYMTIPQFNRSYFVTDVISVRNNIFEIHAKVDVLTTYQNQIRNCKGIISRQSIDWNLYVDDGAFILYQKPELIIKKFPNGFSNPEFVLAIAGG